MNNRVVAVVLALVCVFCFFQPWVYIVGPYFKSGEHFGGLAYGLLWLPIGFGVAYWTGQRSLALVASGTSASLALLVVLSVGFSNVAWALWGSLIFTFAITLMAFFGRTSASPSTKTMADEG